MAFHVRAVVTLVLIAAGSAPEAASAVTARIDPRQTAHEACRYNRNACRNDVLVYTAAPGERNAVEVTPDESQLHRATTVRDPNANIEPGPGCTSNGPHEVECRSEIFRLDVVEILAGDLDDAVAITGGSLFTRLYGGPGDDTLSGGTYMDWLDGGPGDDVMDGNEGEDGLDYRSRQRGVVVDLADPTFPSGTGTERDSIHEVENILGGQGPDVLRGSAGDNDFYGGPGGDRISGGAGSDTIRGEAGDDRLRGNGAADYIYGHRGDDVIVGGCGRDDLYGRSGHDRFYAVDGVRDEISGWRGVDFAAVDRGLDRLWFVERVRRHSSERCSG